jgi:ParB family chromosome partitioning protein
MSREFVSNTIRLLGLPPEMQQALINKQISEGHTRPLLMLDTRKEEQSVLFREIVHNKLTVREAESIARRIAQDRARARHVLDPEMIALEKELMESLGTRVQLERKEKGGKIIIDFFSSEDLRGIVALLHKEVTTNASPDSSPFQEAAIQIDQNDEPKANLDEDLYSIKNFSI